ncbi:class I SAM-dependent methyltransferase [Phytohabitans kaempferiae]|uniref:Class I SAM-dependent methyltransferase n=1 Tax=Phytohabitans kaempferiae TaxID=1620943 RepID=A0ABV6M712_9ACTN
MSTEQATRSLAGFFEQGWERIIATQPPAVRAHLDAERRLAGSLLPAYRGLVEVGCADGSLLRPAAAGAGLDYLGVDLAEGAVAATRAAGGMAVRADVVDLGTLGLPGGPLLVAFPFNVFGDLPDPARALDAVAAAGADALVLTYDTSALAAAVRGEYYEACGLVGDLVGDEVGVHFAAVPFTSSVYRRPVLTSWLAARGWRVSVRAYGAVGLAYHAVR